MIWIGYSLSLLFLLLALHTLRKTRANERILKELKANAVVVAYRHPAKDPLELFEGPACLELFGHVTHIGWVRQGPERIDLLTIEGEALQCDARARYRLTPLTWREFVRECLQRKEERTGRERADIDHARAALEDLKHKHRALREVMASASELLCAGDALPTNPIEQIQQRITDAQRMLIDGLERDDEIPF